MSEREREREKKRSREDLQRCVLLHTVMMWVENGEEDVYTYNIWLCV